MLPRPLPAAAVEDVAAAGPGYLDLSKGDEVSVLYVGSPASGDEGWLYGSLQKSGCHGWIPGEPMWLIVGRRSGDAQAEEENGCHPSAPDVSCSGGDEAATSVDACDEARCAAAAFTEGGDGCESPDCGPAQGEGSAAASEMLAEWGHAGNEGVTEEPLPPPPPPRPLPPPEMRLLADAARACPQDRSLDTKDDAAAAPGWAPAATLEMSGYSSGRNGAHSFVGEAGEQAFEEEDRWREPLSDPGLDDSLSLGKTIASELARSGGHPDDLNPDDDSEVPAYYATEAAAGCGPDLEDPTNTKVDWTMPDAEEAYSDSRRGGRDNGHCDGTVLAGRALPPLPPTPPPPPLPPRRRVPPSTFAQPHPSASEHNAQETRAPRLYEW